jgi:surface polysaccharide O-acyltransferase-like enzyme
MMRVAATFAVILLHVSSQIVNDRAGMPSGDWHAANIVESACRWCVPAFVLLSGALLLDPARHEPFLRFYRKRLLRVGIPLVFWTVFYLAAVHLFGRGSFSVKDMATRALLGRAFLGQYYLLLIMGLYVFTPLLRRFVERASRNELLVAWVLCLGAAMTSTAVDAMRDTHAEHAFSWFAPYLGYYLAGYWLRSVRVQQAHALVAGAVFLLSTGLTATSAAWLSTFEGVAPSAVFYSYHYLSPTVVAMSLSAFVLITYVADRPGARLQRLIDFTGPLTLGIFVAHPLLYVLLTRLDWLPLPSRPALGMLLWPPLLFFASGALTWVIRKIPVVRYVAG